MHGGSGIAWRECTLVGAGWLGLVDRRVAYGGFGARCVVGVSAGRALRGWVNGRFAEALERARWSLRDCGAVGRAAAWSGACATFAAPPSRRRWIRGVRGTVVVVGV